MRKSSASRDLIFYGTDMNVAGRAKLDRNTGPLRHLHVYAALMFSARRLPETLFRRISSIRSTDTSPVSRLQVCSLRATPLAFTKLAPHTTKKNTPLSRTSQIARHLSSSSAHDFSTITDANMASQYKVRKNGAPNTLEHRIYIEKDGVPVSPFHDIPLYANEQQTVLNMVVEIPRWTNGKLEVSSAFNRGPVPLQMTLHG